LTKISIFEENFNYLTKIFVLNPVVAAIDETIPVPERDMNEPFLLPIENLYQIPGRGTVITGNVERGSVKKGEKVDIIGYGKKYNVTVNGMETYLKTLETLEPGDNCGILVKGTII